jgi:hypothetical protein
MVSPKLPAAASGSRLAASFVITQRVIRYRPRRLDLAHGLGGLAVPLRARSDPRRPPSRRHAPSRAPHPEPLGGYQVAYGHGSATYRIRVENPAGAGPGVQSALADGQPVPVGAVSLRDDGREHDVRVTLGNGKR